MKFALLLLVACSCTFFYVKCTSPPLCTGECDKERCPSTDHCACGTHLDYCKCCSFCLKCSGQECSFIANEQCVEGYECKHTEETTGPDFFNKPGTCLKKN